MVLKLTCCRLLLFALLGYRSNAQNYGQGSQNPQNPRYPPSPQGQKQINNPEYPQQPKRPLNPQKPLESFHTCEVAENYRIPCGTNEISASECDAINCCFDGLMLTLQCTKEGLFIVVGARDATLPNTDLETISFYENGHSCNPVGSTSAFAIYEFPVTACGAVVKEEPGVLIYENRMSSLYQVITGPHGSITRDTYNDCPCRDDRYLTTLLPRPSFGFKFPSHHNCFVFKMFHFVGDGSSTQSAATKPNIMPPLQEKLYIHCDVAICQPTLGNNCEPRCFRKRREIAGSVKKLTREETTVVSSPELIFVQRSTESQYPNRS
uniref:Zona pellucida sperm-binding protein 4 n=1 Tax=Pundamilia nyererei TaxID=303518 RepID=A0A3B4F842_9CICH